LGPQMIGGYALLQDIYGAPAIIVRAEMPREIDRQRRQTQLYGVAALLASGIVFSLVIVFLLEKVVLARLIALRTNAATIGREGALSARVEVRGSDELADLAGSVNQMLASLETAEKARQKTEADYHAFVEQSSEGIW